jgi:tetratricopeptide (TPR) repeat protein
MEQPQTAPSRNRRRVKWLVAILLGLVVVAFFQRPRFALITDNFARRALERRDEDAARDWLQISKQIYANGPQTEFLLGRLDRKQGRMSDARRHLRLAKHLGYPEQLVQREEVLAAAQAGQMQLAEPLLPQLLRESDGDGAEICEAYVIGYVRNRNATAALALTDAWARDFPQDPQPLFWAGQIHRDHYSLEQAERYLRSALDKDPQHAGAAFALGELLQEAKRSDEAGQRGRGLL